MSAFRCSAILLIASVSFAQNPQPNLATLTAEGIMARVATNQDRSESLRKQYVYKQQIHIVTHKPGGKLMREETADYNVVPAPDGTEMKLTLLTGRYWHKGSYEQFAGEPTPEEDSLDGDLIKDFRDDLSNDKTKDGLARDLFPLTSKEQKDYVFKLLGQETLQGRDVYHISFWPKDKDEITWAGEAYIDAEEFEPVRVFTKLAQRIPLIIPRTEGHDHVGGKRRGFGRVVSDSYLKTPNGRVAVTRPQPR